MTKLNIFSEHLQYFNLFLSVYNIGHVLGTLTDNVRIIFSVIEPNQLLVQLF